MIKHPAIIIVILILIIGSIKPAETHAVEALIAQNERWTGDFDIPRLGTYGLTEALIESCAEKSGLKNTPVELSPKEISDIIRARM